ncbi:hypothetical protein LSM04_009756 [Trypanosoma melophagium]|uniref:uncharacterized protein n=1 Tax=Trypanosoma melophagium TaxID=715481 RepID=UPI00351A62F9|nr:hypothetical protein LSM04_009756 [Trypanosoma melophagium]
MQPSVKSELEHDFTDDLPVDVALQYRILRKLLSAHGEEWQCTGSAVCPFWWIKGNTKNGTHHSILSPCYLQPQSMVGSARPRRATDYRPPPLSSLLSLPLSLSLSPSRITPVSVSASAEENERTLREIELGGPILDQLVENHLAYTQLYILLKKSQESNWDTLFDYEANQRHLIETISECIFDDSMLFYFKELLEQVSIYSRRATIAEDRERKLQSDIEELWIFNQQLEEELQSMKLSRLSREEGRQEPQSAVHALKMTQEELQMARQVIVELQKQLKDNEVSSREMLRSMMSEVEELKSEYSQLVNSQSNSIISGDRGSSIVPRNNITITSTNTNVNTRNIVAETTLPEFEERGTCIIGLRREIEELRHQLLLKDASIDNLHSELEQLREVARELGASQARVRTLERRLSAATASSGIRG